MAMHSNSPGCDERSMRRSHQLQQIPCLKGAHSLEESREPGPDPERAALEQAQGGIAGSVMPFCCSNSALGFPEPSGNASCCADK